MNDYLTKPIGRKLLVDTVHCWISNAPTVLIVDDSDDSRLLISRMLGIAGRFRILCAEGGKEALEAISRGSIEAVLIDVELGDCKGWEVAASIRQASPATRIMTITAHDKPSIKERCLKAGSMSHVQKPVRLNSLLTLLVCCHIFRLHKAALSSRNEVGQDRQDRKGCLISCSEYEPKCARKAQLLRRLGAQTKSVIPNEYE
ncbi:MAG: response regulator [Myxococcales bacterium]|nr:response regulator [Myxococcales bacterium]